MRKFLLVSSLIQILFGFTFANPTVLDADGVTNTYSLINSVLAPGYDVTETPDCAHPEFGPHITQVWDDELERYVFAFHIHVTPDNDRCVKFDRQRNEIKTYDKSPANLIGTVGEEIEYKWKFKLPLGFKVSSSFTHIHQIKPVGGDESNPIFCLTARKKTPNKLELGYYKSSSLQTLTSANLSLFENTWVEVTEKIKLDYTDGNYSIVIKNVKTGATILSYSNDNILTIRSNNSFIRPKWGIYRSLNSPQDLRDEIVKFASFSIEEIVDTATPVTTKKDNNNFKIVQDALQKQIIINYKLNESSDVTLRLVDITGSLVKVQSYKKQFNADLFQFKLQTANLNDGIYFINIQTDFGQQTKKIIIKN